ncbi:uncharacterized protein LOC116196748 [Punica granatum]|uniref:DUF642 domain-containing protein n=2 Tax=Punica granatum TaxID=22663 RepID=A0A218WF44_PUNGR|nr:uncharacterized protein LOC116196748 [Punica granatum]OWM71435.1 hypothetical protein CDL15_Pgr005622 [Punica granatum]PKI60347.1 hypothetical protein CRG98_019283 [Punica granatum]
MASSSSTKKNTMRLQSSAPLLLLHLLMARFSSSADLLQNPDFESLPTNLPPENSTAEFIPLNQTTTTLPGWTFEGTVLYVNAGKTVSLQRNGSHAVQLGPDGRINQTFTTEGSSGSASIYLLTITVTYSAVGGGRNCTASAAAVVSAPDSRTEVYQRDGYDGKPWQSFGVYLGNWEEGEVVDLVIESMSSDPDPDTICWPIVDSVLLKSARSLASDNGNLLPNQDFELGPEFLTNSTEGILLDQAQSPLQSPLTQWSILGTIKYIDSDHFFVPAGNAAIEIIAGNSTGIQTAVPLSQGSSYTLKFTLGDANDSCVGDLSITAQAGSVLKNYTVQSNGTGSGQSFSMTFEAGSGTTPTPISFLSLTALQTKAGAFCGPVIDDVVLRASMGVRVAMNWSFLLFLALFAASAV